MLKIQGPSTRSPVRNFNVRWSFAVFVADSIVSGLPHVLRLGILVKAVCFILLLVLMFVL
jgi:hypothetical protein